MGFSVGADDYIVKPFSNMELLMRVKAILRRSLITKERQTSDTKASGEGCNTSGDIKAVSGNEKQIVIGDVILDLNSQSVLKENEAISLTYTEFKILELLATHKKKIYSLDNIYQSIWEEEAVGDSAIMVHIKNIRKKLGDNSRNPKYIKTAWGRGYYIEG
jgi:DNA-binding response OmpR family regulator